MDLAASPRLVATETGEKLYLFGPIIDGAE
jgi:hypothetical protein